MSLVAELVTLLYWFHPVSWWTKRQLSRLAELACDEAAAIAIGDRLVYARYLVEIATAHRKIARLQSGAAMARSSDVGQRVRALLDLSKPLAVRVSWPALATILLVGVPVVSLLAAFSPTSVDANEQGTASPLAARPEESPPPAVRTKPDSEPTIAASALVADKKATVTEGLVLTMRGTVFLPNGSVAEDAVLEQSPEYDGSDVVSATIIEGQFEIRTTGTRINPPGILIRSPDWKLQASLNMGSHTLRSECAAPKRVTLVPAKVIQVKVTDGQTAVAGSHVQVEAGSYKYLAITRSDGVAELKIAHDETVFLISAWTDDHRIGGLHAARKPTKDQYGTDFHIEISRGAPLRVRVVDSRRQPVANVPLRFAAATGAHGEMFVGDNPTSCQTTSANGEAVFAWVPNWPTDRLFVSVAENSPWRK